MEINSAIIIVKVLTIYASSKGSEYIDPKAVMEPKTSVSFILNNQPVRIDGASSMMSLNEWIRAQPGLTGTKRMCTEGGCGCCMVSACFTDPTTQKKKTIAINSVYSCLVPLIPRDDQLRITIKSVVGRVCNTYIDTCI